MFRQIHVTARARLPRRKLPAAIAAGCAIADANISRQGGGFFHCFTLAPVLLMAVTGGQPVRNAQDGAAAGIVLT